MSSVFIHKYRRRCRLLFAEARCAPATQNIATVRQRCIYLRNEKLTISAMKSSIMRSRDGRHLSTSSRAASPGTWPKTNYQFPRCSSERLTTVPHHFNFAYRCTLHHFGTDRYEFHMVPLRNTIYRSHNGAYATTVLTIDSHSSLSSRALAGRQLALLRTACKTNLLPKMAMRDWNTRSQHHASFCNVMVSTNETYRYRCILRTHQNVVWQSFKLAQRRQHECRR